MPRLPFSILIAFLAFLLGACGLTERERAVARVNEGIRAVETQSRQVVDAIAALPAGEVAADDFRGVRDALHGYMAQMEDLNASIRTLEDHFTTLQPAIREQFRPSAEAAAVSCQHALDALASPSSSQDDYRTAVTRIGQCIERYATAVTNLSAAYDRLSP